MGQLSSPLHPAWHTCASVINSGLRSRTPLISAGCYHMFEDWPALGWSRVALAGSLGLSSMLSLINLQAILGLLSWQWQWSKLLRALVVLSSELTHCPFAEFDWSKLEGWEEALPADWSELQSHIARGKHTESDGELWPFLLFSYECIIWGFLGPRMPRFLNQLLEPIPVRTGVY